MPTKIILSNIDDFVSLYNSGTHRKDLAKIFNISNGTVDRIFRENKLTKRTSKECRQLIMRDVTNEFDTANSKDIIKNYISGISENKIAKTFNVSRTVIKRILTQNNITRRTQSESESLKWEKMSKEKRLQQVKAAHIAATGRVRTIEEMSLSAKTKQKNLIMTGKGEQYILNWFNKKGFDTIPQMAVNGYNIDIGIGDSIAVELLRNPGNPFAKKSDKRKIENLTNLGWNVIYIWVARNDILVETTLKNIIPIIKRTNSDPSFRGKYWVFRGTGELYSTSSSDLN